MSVSRCVVDCVLMKTGPCCGRSLSGLPGALATCPSVTCLPTQAGGTHCPPHRTEAWQRREPLRVKVVYLAIGIKLAGLDRPDRRRQVLLAGYHRTEAPWRPGPPDCKQSPAQQAFRQNRGVVLPMPGNKIHIGIAAHPSVDQFVMRGINMPVVQDAH